MGEELLEPQVDVVPEDQQDVPAQLVCLERLVPQGVLELRDGEVSKDQLVKKESKDHQESKAWEDQRDQLDQLDSKDHPAQPLTPSPANTSQKCCHSSERSSLRRAHLR